MASSPLAGGILWGQTLSLELAGKSSGPDFLCAPDSTCTGFALGTTCTAKKCFSYVKDAVIYVLL